MSLWQSSGCPDPHRWKFEHIRLSSSLLVFNLTVSLTFVYSDDVGEEVAETVEDQVDRLRNELQAKDIQIAVKNAELIVKDRQLLQKAQELLQKEQEVLQKEQALRQKEQELQSVMQSQSEAPQSFKIILAELHQKIQKLEQLAQV
jgi:N-methylhydantoinase A/oxoprolinase/acetone carboxylase beta subunit